MKSGIYYDISNEDYHKGVGISKSQLDLIEHSPADFIWQKNAPIDIDKTKTLDIGTALHCLLLEPNDFDNRFAIEQKLDKRTKAGKEAAAEFEINNQDKTILTHDEGKKLSIMRDSAMAHPIARWCLEAIGKSESSIYWEDSETEILCRCRPDKIITEHSWIVDVKSTADIHKFDRSFYDYRYHVQDAFYSDGYYSLTEEIPVFVFLVISTTVNCGRYPVRIFIMDEQAKEAGRIAYKTNLKTYSECLKNDEWPGLHTLSLPYYAKELRND